MNETTAIAIQNLLLYVIAVFGTFGFLGHMFNFFNRIKMGMFAKSALSSFQSAFCLYYAWRAIISITAGRPFM